MPLQKELPDGDSFPSWWYHAKFTTHRCKSEPVRGPKNIPVISEKPLKPAEALRLFVPVATVLLIVLVILYR